MTSTNINVGLEGLPRNSSKVLKPPGGGSSDIFGADSAEPRRVRNTNHLQSSVFGDAMETASNKSKTFVDSHTRLFGNTAPPAEVVTTAPASVVQDEAPGDATVDHAEKVETEVDGNVKESADGDASGANEADRRNPINHNGMTEADCSQSYGSHRQRGQRIADGNPVTGEGYAIANGVKEVASAPAPMAAVAAPVKVNGEAKPKSNGVQAAPPSAPPSRGRVPPGGYSSGLW